MKEIEGINGSNLFVVTESDLLNRSIFFQSLLVIKTIQFKNSFHKEKTKEGNV